MKKFTILILPLMLCNILFGQLSIGTNSIENGIIFKTESQDKGVLFPRIKLTDTKIFEPITGTKVNGLIVYNTNTNGTNETKVTPGLYYWDVNEWKKMAVNKRNETALFSNQNTTVDINSGSGIFADLFANTRFNNNTNLYQVVNQTTLRINEVGYYKVILNLDLSSSGGADNFGIEIVVNDTDNIVSDNMYIPGRWDSEGGDETKFPNGKSFIIYVPVNIAGHTIRVRTYELDPGTDVFFKNPNTSTISIEKIR